MQRYRRLIRYAWHEWPALALLVLFTAITSALAALQPWPLKMLFDWALGSEAPPAWLAGWLSGLGKPAMALWVVGLAAAAGLLVFALQSAVEVATTWAWSAAGQRMVYALAGDLFSRLQRLALTYHTRGSVGDSLSRLTGDAWCLNTVADGLLIGPLQHVLTLATVGAVAWRLDPAMAALSLAVAPLLGAAAFLFGNALKRRARVSREAQSKLMSFVHQTITAIPVVNAFGAERRNRGEYRRLAETAVAASQRQTILRSMYGFVNGLITTCGAAVLIWFGGKRVLAGELPVGSLLVLLGYLRSMQGATQGLMGVYGTVKSVEASIDRVLEVLDCSEEVADPPAPAPMASPFRGRVTMEGVSFGYAPDKAVLSDISLTVEPGQTVALVGATGAGKSTLVALVPRLYDPWRGCVRFDGVDVRAARVADVRARVAMVLQEPFLLPLSVAKNIAYGRPAARRAEIVAAAEAARADGFIRELPEGYDTVIGERGVTLSGGQRQRLAIARALLKNAPILILDEPTAALDPSTEALLIEAVEELMRGRTTFIIAHRLSTVRRADRIAVLESGRIVEIGNHGQLMAAGGVYRRLHDTQFGGGVGS